MMADTKLSAWPEVTSVLDTDLDPVVIDPGGTPLHKRVTMRNRHGGGWINSGQTWAYASATTITVPTGAAAIYSIGDKIRLTQTTVKYFNVITVADTVLTVTGGSDYTVANAAITAPGYSKVVSPVGFPASFNYSPTVTTINGTITTLGTVTGTFSIIAPRIITITVSVAITTNGSGADGIKITTPIPVNDLTTSVGREVSTGGALLCTTQTNIIYVYRLTDLAYPGADGRTINLNMTARLP
jgi:hypothetical protein